VREDKEVNSCWFVDWCVTVTAVLTAICSYQEKEEKYQERFCILIRSCGHSHTHTLSIMVPSKNNGAS